MHITNYTGKIALFFFVLMITSKVYSQSDSLQWFAQKGVFPFLQYDLLEVQPFTGVMYLEAQDVDFKGAYIPVNIGFKKSFIQWTMWSVRFDLAMGAASFTQFDMVVQNENLKGGLLNTDFKASAYLNGAKGAHKFRIQVFHLSSHLGDDYMVRNGDLTPNDKTVNYEQLDLTYLYGFRRLDIYGGLGMVITKNAFRDRFMAEMGFQANVPLKHNWDFVYGLDMKLYDQNEFIPDIHYGLGFTFSQRNEHQINISLDGFYGHMPYSTLKYGLIMWYGVSSKLYL